MNNAVIMKTLDPYTQQLLALARQAAYPPFQALTPENARAAFAAGWASMQMDGGEVASVKDVNIDSPGGPLKLRIYRGEGTHAQTQWPCMLFLHGGGWVNGNLESHDRLCRRLANVARLCVIVVDYRLAPDHPFPAAIDDSACSWQWVHSNAKDLNIDPSAIAVGAYLQGRSSLLQGVSITPSAGAEQKAAHLKPSEMPYGRQKQVEFARALMQKACLVMHDEPMAGMSADEKKAMSSLIQRV
jgi:carboxylesterase type B